MEVLREIIAKVGREELQAFAIVGVREDGKIVTSHYWNGRFYQLVGGVTQLMHTILSEVED